MIDASLSQELHSLEADSLVTFYVLDATELGGDLLFFYPGTEVQNEPIVWQGTTYFALPVEVTGFEFKGQGSPPRPSITFGNVGGLLSGILIAHDDLIGAQVRRKRTFRRYLDGQPGADPTRSLIDDVYFIERKTAENRFSVRFELAIPTDIDDTGVPARIMQANLCSWHSYRGEGCEYAGPPVADVFDAPPGVTLNPRGEWTSSATYAVGDYVWRLTARGVRRYAWVYTGAPHGEAQGPANTLFWTADECSRRTSGCRLRFGLSPLGLPFGGFPATSRMA